MDQTQHYIQFLDDTSPLDAALHAPDHRLGARALLGMALELGHLDFDGPWRINATHSMHLTNAAGYTPAGGWHGLAGLLAGCGVLKADNTNGFVPAMPMEALLDLDAQGLQTLLVESMTRYLVPPTTTAGFFMLLGLHPGWGLRLVHEAQRETLMATHRTLYDSPSLYPKHILSALEHGIFTALSAIFDILRATASDKRYQCAHFATLIQHACVLARRGIERKLPHHSDLEMPLFVLQLQSGRYGSVHRSMEFLLADLFDHFLIPAGVVQRFNDQTFSVLDGALHDNIRMHHVGTLANSNGLAALLTDNIDQLVA